MRSSRPACKQACHLGNDPNTSLPLAFLGSQADWETPDTRGMLACFLLMDCFVRVSRKAIRRQDHRQAVHSRGVWQVSTNIQQNAPALQEKG